MREVRGANFALAAVMAVSFWSGASLADAPSGAPDYLFRLPDREWAVGASLAGGRAACGPAACEAGYHSGDLVLSVRRGERELMAVAAVRGCGQVAWRRIGSRDLNGLTPFDKYTVISRAALSAARAARSRCGSQVSDLIDTQVLVAVVPDSGWPYPDGGVSGTGS